MAKEFHIFKIDTDAPATNRGFYFQYLLTLLKWVKSYPDPTFEIFCEVEEDILSIDPANKSRNYTQVKCYASGFSLRSPELLKSVINFYKIYLNYQGTDALNFTFCATGGIRPYAGQLLQQWVVDQESGMVDIGNYLDPVRKELLAYVTSELRSFSRGKMEPSLLARAESNVETFTDGLNARSFEEFLKRITWRFVDFSAEDFEPLLRVIADELANVPYNIAIGSRVMIGFLMHKIMEVSSLVDAGDRKLDHTLFKQLLNESNDISKIHEVLHGGIAQLFELMPRMAGKLDQIDQNTKALIAEIRNRAKPLTIQEIFFEDLRGWLEAIGYEFGQVLVFKSEQVIFDIIVPVHRRSIRVLILGVTRHIDVPALQLGKQLMANYDCEEIWLVTPNQISPAAKAALKSTDNDIFCYNFDELIEETIDFSKYFDWVEKEIAEKNIMDRYISVGVKKGEFNQVTKEVIATSFYKEAEGWLEGYIDNWLTEQQKEHVSILGQFGTGKTWFSLHYTWKQIEHYRTAKARGQRRPRIPILIFLRDFAKAMQVDVLISDFFFRKHQIDIKGVFKAFDQLNKMGKLLLIFDGFDEMADRIDKQKMIDNFWELSSVVKGQSKVILTCRNEHFATVNEGRTLLNAEYRNTTKLFEGESPKFEIVELLMFEPAQIRKLLSFHTNPPTIELIFNNSKILDLLSRPVMSELVLDAIKEVEAALEVDLAKVYYYACRRKMERDIAEQRTFTTLQSKFFFLCELSWEMLSTYKLTISFKEFPDLIYQYFGVEIEQKDLDYWRYDLRGQSILIIDDETGNYKPAHKSMIEFFVAYKIASELELLKPVFTADESGMAIPGVNQLKPFAALKPILNWALFASPAMNVVAEFLVEMIVKDESNLWSLYEEALTDRTANKIMLNNLLFLLVALDADFSGRDLSSLDIENIEFADSDFSGADLRKAIIRNGMFVNCNMSNVDMRGAKMLYKDNYPVNRDLNGENLFGLLSDGALLRLGHLGFLIIAQDATKKHVPFKNRHTFITDLKTIPGTDKAIVVIEDRVSLFNLTTGQQKLISGLNRHIWRTSFDRKASRLAIVTDSGGSGDFGEIVIIKLDDLKQKAFNVKNRGIFTSCFANTANHLICGGRDGVIMTIDMANGNVVKMIDYQTIGKGVASTRDNDRSTQSEYIYDLSITADDRYLAIVSTHYAVIIWDLVDCCIKKIIDQPYYSTHVSFSPDGRWLAFDQTLGGLTVVRTSDWAIQYSYPKSISMFLFSPDSQQFHFGTDDESTDIYAVNTSNWTLVRHDNQDMSFLGLQIGGLIAPANVLRYYIKRGATGWYTKEEIADLADKELETLTTIKLDGRDRNEVSREIFEYIYSNK